MPPQCVSRRFSAPAVNPMSKLIGSHLVNGDDVLKANRGVAVGLPFGDLDHRSSCSAAANSSNACRSISAIMAAGEPLPAHADGDQMSRRRPFAANFLAI